MYASLVTDNVFWPWQTVRCFIECADVLHSGLDQYQMTDGPPMQLDGQMTGTVVRSPD